MKKLTLLLIALLAITAIGISQDYALQFDGTDAAPEYVNCGTNISPFISGTTLSVEAWIYPTDFKTASYENTIISLDPLTSPLTRGVTFRFGGSGQLSFVFGDGTSWYSALSATGVLILNKWQHVAATYDGVNVILYVDGVDVKTEANTASIAASNNVLLIGASPAYANRQMAGNIDEVRIWTTTRSATDIQNNMMSTLVGNETGLLAYYAMTNGSGTTLTDNTTANNYDGTLQGNTLPTWIGGAFPIYVDAGASGSNDGSSWANAYNNTSTAFQDALTAAADGNQIWVAAGTYKPSVAVGGTGTRYQTFQMINGVSIYGGFASNETAVSQRTDYGSGGANETILSGDIGTVGVDTDNCYHVFYHPDGTGLTNSAILDGFTVTKGYANGASHANSGAGMYNNNNNPTIKNVLFSSNHSSNGAAIYATSATSSSLVIVNSVFINNSSNYGGSIYSINNHLSITNCTFANSSAINYGGAIEFVGPGYVLTAKNSIFWGNTAGQGTNAQIFNGATANYYNCDIQGSGGSSGWNGTALGTDGGNNIDSDPLFADAGADDCRLSSLSPCADVGLDAANSETTDIRGSGFGRKLLKTNYLTTGTIDMGAYEFNSNTDPPFSTLIWTGTTSTDFTVAGNWDGGVPDANYNVRIPNVANDPIIGATQTADCNNLTVESGATLTLQSIADGSTGSLIINGILSNSGTITSQRFFPGATLLNWHMVSAPVTGMDIAASGFAPISGDFYAWVEPTPGTWVNYENTTVAPTFATVNGGDNFVGGKGYLLAFNEANPQHDFVGNLNVGNQTFTLKNSAVKNYAYSNGWNLLGNPYSSAIDWNNADMSQFQDNFAYAYDPAAGVGAGGFVNIDGTNPNAFIAANQAFFVHATTAANNQVFTFTNAMQAHGGTYYKNKAEDDKLVLRFTGEQYYDETTIRQREESTFNKDRVDAFKMNSFNTNAPNIYTISDDNINLAINSIPEVNANNNIRLGFVSPKTGLYTISVIEASNYMMDHNIYLEDLLLNTLHKISESDYNFTSDTGDINDRFIIHFGVLGVDEPTTQTELIQIWAVNRTINIHNANNYAGDIKVLNMFGQTILKIQLTGNQTQQIRVNAPSGYYIINTITKKGTVNKKVYLK